MTNQEIRFATNLFRAGLHNQLMNYLAGKGSTLQNFTARMNQVIEADRKIALRAKNKAQAVAKAKAEAARVRSKANALKAQATILRQQNVSPMNRIVKPILAVGAIIVAVVFIKRKKKKKVTRKRRK